MEHMSLLLQKLGHIVGDLKVEIYKFEKEYFLNF